jgi:proteasome lid subunit RPN8/RPN11
MLNVDHKPLAILWRHALDAYPYECCGVLLGRRDGEHRHVLQAVPCRNVHPSPKSRYAIDPAELISMQRDARDMQLEIVGFYHSHPDHPAQYSGTDLDEAHWHGCSYVIVGVDSNAVTEARSYLFHADGDHRFFVEEPLVEAVHP